MDVWVNVSTSSSSWHWLGPSCRVSSQCNKIARTLASLITASQWTLLLQTKSNPLALRSPIITYALSRLPYPCPGSRRGPGEQRQEWWWQKTVLRALKTYLPPPRSPPREPSFVLLFDLHNLTHPPDALPLSLGPHLNGSSMVIILSPYSSQLLQHTSTGDCEVSCRLGLCRPREEGH